MPTASESTASTPPSETRSTDRRPESVGVDHTASHRRGRYGIQLVAIAFWLGLGRYGWAGSTGLFEYLTLILCGTLCLSLLTSQFRPSYAQSNREQSHWGGRWVERTVVGLSVATLLGTTILIHRQSAWVAIGQPVATTPTVVASSIVLMGILLGLTTRVFGWRVGGALLIAACYSVLAVPRTEVSGLLTHVVFSTDGIYGPLLQATVTWIAPVCLLVGLWRAIGLPAQVRWRLDQLLDARDVPPGIRATVGELFGRSPPASVISKRHARQTLAGHLRQLWPPTMGLTAFLLAWLVVDVSYLTVVVTAILPATLVVVTFLFVRSTIDQQPDQSPHVGADARGHTPAFGRGTLAVLLGGPLAAIAVALTLETTLTTALYSGVVVAGSGCVVVPTLQRQPAEAALSSTLTTGVKTVGEGSLWALTRFSGLCLLLGTVGAVGEALTFVGAVTTLSNTVLTVAFGSTSLAIGGLLIGCLGLGWLLPTVGGYGLAALLVVPILQTHTAVSALTAHFVVLYAVVFGAALATPLATSSSRALQPADDGGPDQSLGYRSLHVAPFVLFPILFISQPALLSPTGPGAAVYTLFPVVGGVVLFTLSSQQAGRRWLGRSEVESGPKQFPFYALAGVIAGCIAMFAVTPLVQYPAVAIGFVGRWIGAEQNPLDRVLNQRSQ